jgi:hypothetical protein
MTRWQLRCVLAAFVFLAVIPTRASAQDTATQSYTPLKQGKPAAPPPRVVWPHGDDTVSTVDLRAEAESDDVIPGLQLNRLADGSSFAMMQIAGTKRTHASYVAIDTAAGTYRTFKHNGPIAKDRRIKAYLKNRFKIELDDTSVATHPGATAANAPRASRPWAALGHVPRLMGRVPVNLFRRRVAPSITTRLPRRPAPQAFASSASLQDGSYGHYCSGWADGHVVTLDLVDYLPGIYHALTEARSQASAATSYDSTYGWWGWGSAYSWSIPEPGLGYMTPFGTHWFVLSRTIWAWSDVGYGETYLDGWFGNEDFATIILGHPEWTQLTTVENVTGAYVNAEGGDYPLAFGVRGGGWSWPFLSFDVFPYSDQNCWYW